MRAYLADVMGVQESTGPRSLPTGLWRFLVVHQDMPFFIITVTITNTITIIIIITVTVVVVVIVIIIIIIIIIVIIMT